MMIDSNQSEIPLKFYFKKISKQKNKSRSIWITVSGFTSDKTDNKINWKQMIQVFQGMEVFSLEWRSQQCLQSIKYFVQKGINLLEIISFNKFGAFRAFLQSKQIYQQNPFIKVIFFQQAYNQAKVTGKMFADILIKVFPNQIINLIAFSLGTRLVQLFLTQLKSKQLKNMIGQVILLGGIAEKNNIENLNFNITNFYSQNDHTVRVAYRLCKPFSQPIGIHRIQKHKNYNISYLVNGHKQYREKMQRILKQGGINKDFLFLER